MYDYSIYLLAFLSFKRYFNSYKNYEVILKELGNT